MARAPWVLAGLCAVAGEFGCGSSAQPCVDPNTAFTAAHDIQVKVKVAEDHLTTCMSDSTQCYTVQADLREIGASSAVLEQAAVQAGAKQ
jgi:hypothetical protein